MSNKVATANQQIVVYQVQNLIENNSHSIRGFDGLSITYVLLLDTAPSKREYFFGFKLHALVDDRGLFREVHLLEGRLHDLEGLVVMSFWGVSGNEVIGDRAYVNYSIEDELAEVSP